MFWESPFDTAPLPSATPTPEVTAPRLNRIAGTCESLWNTTYINGSTCSVAQHEYRAEVTPPKLSPTGSQRSDVYGNELGAAQSPSGDVIGKLTSLDRAR